MKITISYEEYKREIIAEAHRLMVQEAIADRDSERKRIRDKIRACEEFLARLEGMRQSKEESQEENREE